MDNNQYTRTARKTTKRADGEELRNNSIDVSGIRRRQIIGAVRQIIARDGIDAVTIANIATELGTSRGVVIYHFKNKDEILHEVLVSAMQDADRTALRIGLEKTRPEDKAALIIQVAKLAKGSGDWWKIYFAYLAHSHVNDVYREALDWSDANYRRALTRAVGSEERAMIFLALMKGLAMQVAVMKDAAAVDGLTTELNLLLDKWLVNPA
jgi:AcrR family transcriptional regulator